MSERDTKAKEYDAVVSGLRDEPCAFKRQCFRDGWDAAIAALPDMVEPLEWERLLENNYMSGDYCAYYCGCHFGGKLKYAWGYGTSVRFGAETLEAAKAAAQAHHTAAILSALGVAK